MHIRRLLIQTHSDSGTPCFSHLNHKRMFPLNIITIKVHKYTKYVIKMCNFFKFVVCFQYLRFSSIYMLTRETEVIKCCNLFTKTWHFSKNQHKRLQMNKNWSFVSNIMAFPLIKCVYERDGIGKMIKSCHSITERYSRYGDT